MSKSKKIFLAVLVGLIAVLAIGVLVSVLQNRHDTELKNKLTIEEAQIKLDEQLDALPTSVAQCIKYVRDNMTVVVKDVEYGHEKNIILHCTYKTLDVYSVIEDNINVFLGIDENKPNGKPKNGTEVQIEVLRAYKEKLESKSEITGDISIELYELSD